MQMMFQQFKTKLAEQKVDSPKETAQFKKLSPAEKMAVKDIYIMIGKTNTAELGVGAHTANRLFGITPNIYGNSKSSGGSSGGASVAVASDLLPFADGTDMMGSCRTPAAYTNIYGFRPTPGLIPDYRTNPKKDKLPILSTPGCMARTPNDLSIILDNVSGEHKSDPYSFSLKNCFLKH